MSLSIQKPTPAFIGVSWAVLGLGLISYFIGLNNADLGLGEKGYYFIIMLFALFAVISLQKTVRDRQQEIPVTGIYYGIAWTAALASILLMAVGLWNATFTLAEKGFYGMSFVLTLFAATAVQKNIRDVQAIDMIEGTGNSPDKPSWLKAAFAKPRDVVGSEQDLDH